MQYFTLKAYPEYAKENAAEEALEEVVENKNEDKTLFLRILDSLLDGGRMGVEVGLAIIPGVLIISTLVFLLTNGAPAEGYNGGAYQGVELLPMLAQKIDFIFEWLFGFTDPHLVAFPITALGAVGAALGLVPNFVAHGWIDGNAIAVFTAIGMCWSGYLSTHTAMLDSIGYRHLTPKAILAHTIGGLVAAIVAHWIYVVVNLL
jgi:spore maturation protein SpmB